MEIYSLKPNTSGHCALNSRSFEFRSATGLTSGVANTIESLEKLGFAVQHAHLDLAGKEIKSILDKNTKESGDYFNKNSCSFCLVIPRSFTENNQALSVNNKPENFTSLISNSKFFFIQACRDVEAVPFKLEYKASDETRSLPDFGIISSLRSRIIPEEADLVIHYATVEKRMNNQIDSSFIKSICHVLDNHSLTVKIETDELGSIQNG
jgi:hypothetical protein